MMKLLMNNFIAKFILVLTFFCVPFFGFSNDGLFKQLMTTSDKMFVVVIVILIIFFGIILFLTLLDKKLKQLERKVDNK